jgi:RNA polymerase sigma factor (sigma-70 family)
MRRYVAARAEGDEPAILEAWKALVTHGWDRVEGTVATYGRRHLWNDHERDDALSNAALRLMGNLRRSFEGTTIDELMAAFITVAKIAVLDVKRAAAKQSARQRPLETSDDEDRPDPVERLSKLEFEKRMSDLEARAAARELHARGAAFFDWAVPQLPPKPRQVFELIRAGHLREEVMDRLEMTRNTVDKNHSRALKILSQLKEQYES